MVEHPQVAGPDDSVFDAGDGFDIDRSFGRRGDNADAAVVQDGFSTQGDRDLADRAALRRVAGLSTELTDVTEVEYRKLQLERVVLVGVWAGGTAADAEASMAELARLAETAGSVVLEALVQRRSHPDGATYIGSGKVTELIEIVETTGADTVICDGELTPSQLRNLEERLKVKVVDRTALILDIFAQHARSREGKAQVELAQLNYLVPRLRGWGAALSRQRGGRVAAGAGIGSRGPGETKLEIDRRRIHKRISQLKSDLTGMRRVRDTKRSQRRAKAVPAVSIAGYTNAGKSSLLNRLTDAGVLVEDALFATLDPDHAQVPHHRRPGLHPHRHGRFRPASAAPVGGVVPVDARGDRGLRSACCTSSTARTSIPRSRLRQSARCSARSTRWPSRRSSW